MSEPEWFNTVRLRRGRDVKKKEFQRSRMSGDYGYNITDNNDDHLNNYKVATLDPGLQAGAIQHKLRPLLRNKYLSSGGDMSGYGAWYVLFWIESSFH